MNVRTHREFEHRKILKDAGWEISQRDAVAFNSGSETFEHFMAKAALAWSLKQQGYRIGSEVAKDSAGEVDVAAYGLDDPPVAVECERSMTEDVMADKLARYVDGEPFRDMLPVDVDSMPDVEVLREWADEQI